MKELKLNLQGSWKRVLAMLTVAAMCFTVVGVSPTFAAEDKALDGVTFKTATKSEDVTQSEVTINGDQEVTMSESDTDVAFTATATIVVEEQETKEQENADNDYTVKWESSDETGAVTVEKGKISVVTPLEADVKTEITVAVTAGEIALESAPVKLTVFKATEAPGPGGSNDEVSAAEVEKMINELPAVDKLTLEDKDAVEAARAAYDELSEAAQKLVAKEAVATLEAAEARIKELEEGTEEPNPADVSAAEAVEKMINELPAKDDLKLENKADVETARAAYDALSEAAQKLVAGEAVATLEAAEAQIAKLEKDAAAAKKAADDAAKLINDLPAADKLTLADKAKVDAAKKAYDALSADAKALVPKTTVDKLNAAVAKIAELEKAAADADKKTEQPTKATTAASATALKVGTKKVVAGVTYQVAKNNTVTYQKPKKNATKVTIPATVKINGKTYKVTTVAKNAFKGNKKVKTVKVGKNVTSIGASAFQNCKALTTVTLPAKTTTIGKNAFAGSKKLKKIVIKSTKMTTKTIKNGAFKKVSKKTTVDVPNKKAKTYKKLFQKKGLPKACKVK